MIGWIMNSNIGAHPASSHLLTWENHGVFLWQADFIGSCGTVTDPITELTKPQFTFSIKGAFFQAVS